MSKKKLIVPMVTFLVAALILTVGSAYALAHYGETEISDNSTDDVYATLTPQSDSMFSGVFNKTIYYNTHIHYDGGRIVQYYLTPGQTTSITVNAEGKTVIALGTIIFHLEQFGDVQNFNLFIQKLAGTMNGTFYIGIATSADGETYGEMTYVPFTQGGTTISNLSSSVAYIKVMLFVESSFHTDGATSITQPLDDVSFIFRADVLA